MTQSMGELHTVVDGIISERRQHFKDGGDLLSSLMQAHDSQTGEAMTDQELRNQVMTLMLAGYETTASALTWTWYLLSENQAARERLRSEARQVLAGRTPRYADISSLADTRNALSEGLRLFPPAIS